MDFNLSKEQELLRDGLGKANVHLRHPHRHPGVGCVGPLGAATALQLLEGQVERVRDVRGGHVPDGTPGAEGPAFVPAVGPLGALSAAGVAVPGVAARWGTGQAGARATSAPPADSITS